MKASDKSKKVITTKKATVPGFKTVEEYIRGLPDPTKAIVKELRRLIQQAAPDAEEMISYNMPAFKLNGKGLIWYAAWKEHISLYPRTTALEAAIEELAHFAASKGTIKFSLRQPVPFDIIQQIVKVRIDEIKIQDQRSA